MNPPPMDMTQAQECLRGAQEQPQACIELRRAAASRIAELEAENAALRNAIEAHAAMGHERCHENDKALYAAAGIEQDCTLPPKDQWMHDCERYWECRKSGIAEWPSVTQLQAELDALKAQNKALTEAVGEQQDRARQRSESILTLIEDKARLSSPIIELILEERKRQDEEWGGPSHDDQHSALDWPGFIRKQLNRLFEEYMNGDWTYKDYDTRMAKIGALVVAGLESQYRIRRNTAIDAAKKPKR